MEKRRFQKDAVDDLVLLDQIDEDNVIKHLRNRFDQDLIYTRIGPVLVSVNPFKEIRGLYSEGLQRRYFGEMQHEVAPHVYGVAEETFRNLMTTSKDQVVLISGESGAGKTEAAKTFLSYVTKVSQDRAEVNTGGLSVREIKDALLQSNPVLEAFGNATTVRNNNSSRFGKYMNIYFDYAGTPLGGAIKTYLLEKPRVVHQSEGERSFHVLYQICTSRDRELALGSPDDFNYIRGTTKVRGIDDSRDFQEMTSAMDAVGINPSEKKDIFSVLAAILHLGNVEFEAHRGDKISVSRNTKDSLANAARLLQVSEKDLAKALTNRTIQSRIEKVTSPLTSVNEGIKTRDALAKALYSRNFLHLIEVINRTIHTDLQELTMGILDIYGFEIFETNSFEQLCINYCNEKLQQLFIELTLKSEQEEYKKEGIRWNKIDYFDNKGVCDLIEATRPAGIFAYMDEENLLAGGTDKTYLKKLEANLSRHKHYVSLATKTKHDLMSFEIKHYAGSVVYTVDGILAKNKDTLFRDLIELVGKKSRSDFLNQLFPEGKAGHDGKRPITAGKAFVRDMQLLIDDLSKCEPHYIRTIKSNDQKRGGMFTEELVRHQVKYLGIVENVRVRRAGFAYRSRYEFFVKRYKMLSSSTWPRESGNDERDTQTILRDVGISDSEQGKTKIFIKEPQSVFQLEEAREKQLHVIAKIIQKAYRGYKARLYFMRLRVESAHLLHGKKRRRGSWVLYFIGDYLHAQDNEMITSQIDGRIKFADHVNVMASKYKMVRQTLVITNSSLFIFDTQYKLLHSWAFREIKTFGLSTFADGYIVLDVFSDTPKPVPTVIMESMRKAEIATVLNDLTKKSLPLKFQDQYPINILKKSIFGKKILERTLVFQESRSIGERHTYIAATKQDNPDFKTTIRIDVGMDYASNAQLQLDDPIPDRLLRFKGRPGQKKKLVYGGRKY